MSSQLASFATTDFIQSLITEKGIEFFLCSFVEMSGVSKAKLIPAPHLQDMMRDGAGFAGFAAGSLGQGPHDADIVSIPDLNSVAVLPWRKTVAWAAGNLYVEGRPWPFCPRTILTRQLERAKELGYTFNVGTEPEFMLLKRGPEGRFVPWDDLDDSTKPCYDLRALYRNLDIMTTLVGYLQELGWDPYEADHEDANCQF
jgi:glutamine synthetase